MYKVIESYFHHQDPRGSITGIINTGKWEELNYITSVKNTVRGGHYHKETEELFFIFKGIVKISFEKVVNDKRSGQIEVRHFNAGDAFIVLPNVCHTFEVLEDSTWINVLSKKIDKAIPDFYKV